MSTEQNWYALYVRNRWEKKVASQLEKKNLTTYCPLVRKTSQWSDRKKIVYEPLFSCYVFVRISSGDMIKVLQTDGVLNFVHWLGKPAVIKDSEIQTIQRYLNQGLPVCVERMEFELNDEVKIVNGPLMEFEGNIIEISKNKVKLYLNSLQYIMTVEIDKSDIESIQKTARVTNQQLT